MPVLLLLFAMSQRPCLLVANILQVQDAEDDARVRQGRPYCGMCSHRHSSGFTAKALSTVLYAVAASVPDVNGQNQVSPCLSASSRAAATRDRAQVPCEESPLQDLSSDVFRNNHVVYLESLISPESGLCWPMHAGSFIRNLAFCFARLVFGFASASIPTTRVPAFVYPRMLTLLLRCQ